MITVRMTIDDEQGLQEFQSFLDGTQNEQAEAYKAAHPDANVILFRVVEDGTYRYGPIIEQADCNGHCDGCNQSCLAFE
jgi:hypothetical protein